MRTCLSSMKKMELQKDIQSGKTDQSIMEKYNISSRTLRNEKKKVKDGFLIQALPSKNKYRNRNSNFQELEEIVINEITSKRSFGFQISKAVLIEKAKRTKEEIINNPSSSEELKNKYQSFKFSDKWFDSFKKRNEIKFLRINGEAASVPVDTSAKMEVIKRIIVHSGLPISQIYNFDETGLEYRNFGNFTYAVKGDAGKGRKRDKTQVSLLLGVNGDGSDIRTHLIGKSKRPKGITGEDYDVNKIKYHQSENAWMTSKIFEEIMIEFDRSLTSSAIVLIDNFRGHTINPPPNFLHIRIIFLPPNSTSLTQPLDNGIIALFLTIFLKV